MRSCLRGEQDGGCLGLPGQIGTTPHQGCSLYSKHRVRRYSKVPTYTSPAFS